MIGAASYDVFCNVAFRLRSFVFVAIGASTAYAQTQDTIASLHEAARKEGKIVIWSSLDTDVHHAQLKAFSRKFPGLTIEAFKIPPGPAVERAITESRAGKVNVDILDTNSGYLQLLFDRELVKPYDWDKIGRAHV